MAHEESTDPPKPQLVDIPDDYFDAEPGASKGSPLDNLADLPAAAADLNAASNELAAPIKKVENYLEALNVGVSIWVKVKGWEDGQHGAFWKRELGYDRFSSGWRIGIRESRGNEHAPEDTEEDTWTFNQSPRKARISAVEKLPELLNELTKEAKRTARRLREKTTEANAFASTLKLPKAKK